MSYVFSAVHKLPLYQLLRIVQTQNILEHHAYVQIVITELERKWVRVQFILAIYMYRQGIYVYTHKYVHYTVSN